jgi:transcriptional regulator with XRE-family HTH domain
MRPTVRSRRLGSRLGHYRRQRGLSGTELATRLGIHQATWSKIEAGKTKLSPAMLVRPPRYSTSPPKPPPS